MYLICPDRREKKKTVAGQVVLCAQFTFSPGGGFETHFKAAVLHALMGDDDPVLNDTAALGGSRREAQRVST